MLKLMCWMASFGSTNARVYRDIAKRLGNGNETARFLRTLARSESELSRALLSSADKIGRSGRNCMAPEGLHGLSELVKDSFAFLGVSIEAGEEAFIEGLLQCEQLKWTSITVPLASRIAEFPQAAQVLAHAQKHKRKIDRFFEDRAHLRDLSFRLKASQSVWVERFLLVGDFHPEVATALKEDGIVEVASHGEEAIERLRENYYAAVLSETGLSRIDGIEVCKKASRIFPGIEERFLFIYGELTKKQRGFIDRKGLRRVPKHTRPEKVRSEVALILER
ncbi:MAG TPA: hypothetical protein DDW94_12585 [Deltaproteobacteria bacterium]|nr:MAG: hypothetical protein A2Z79_07190 [Deltaproteobacteria bacterium GWA2_55_82]OGQ63212.1 MAG: hypothetical protein A3I81_00410 [Deltaproteobacteria bacterium RIFCSPLOWO2_02_FULL_55_12]OIJ73046.1 MAG: hypothetical protein A2V21_301475 [Deltaproteobacteria bacterium GWC2_55_46]HBG47807.1 hypothetical protein [Deltaproteobacteria bacterium]HCY11930.1 hypothetical protein [Deltaproteobacteria bacterium]